MFFRSFFGPTSKVSGFGQILAVLPIAIHPFGGRKKSHSASFFGAPTKAKAFDGLRAESLFRVTAGFGV